MPMLIIGGDGKRETRSSMDGFGSNKKEDNSESSSDAAVLFKKAIDRGNPRLIKEAFKAMLDECGGESKDDPEDEVEDGDL